MSRSLPDAAGADPPWESAAFGLRVAGAAHLLPAGPAAGMPGSVDYRESDAEELARRWHPFDAIRRSRSPGSEGELEFTLDHSPSAGYRLWARTYGSCLVSLDGRRVLAAPGGAATGPWRAFLIGQVLPLCAALQGLEPFHASGIAWGDAAVAFVGPSGVGKTSLAMHSALRGARFLTDDVLAISATPGGTVLAHPGAPLASLRPSEERRLRHGELERLGPRVSGERDRAAVQLEPADRPLPLRVVYFLERVGDGERARVAGAADPRLLLGSSFVFAVRDRARLVRQLDLCARLSHQALLAHVRVPPGIGARELAAMLERHAAGAARPPALRPLVRA